MTQQKRVGYFLEQYRERLNKESACKALSSLKNASKNPDGPCFKSLNETTALLSNKYKYKNEDKNLYLLLLAIETFLSEHATYETLEQKFKAFFRGI